MTTLQITQDTKTVTIDAANKDLCAYDCIFFEGPSSKVPIEKLKVRCKLYDSELKSTKGIEGCYFLRSQRCKNDFVAT